MLPSLVIPITLVLLFGSNFASTADLIAGQASFLRQVEAVDFTPSNEHTTLVHVDRIHHKGASFLTVHFATFHLGPGDWVVVRSPSNRDHYEYVGMGRNDLGVFYSSTIHGDSLIVEYHMTRQQQPFGGYSIDHYTHGFAKDIGVKDSNQQEILCGEDNSKPSKCYKDDLEKEIYVRSKAVARLKINGAWLCTGWLVGCEGYLLTNAHCIESQEHAFNTDYEFMAESGSCQEECQTASGCPGEIIATGADLIALDKQLDYALVKLKTKEGVDLSQYGHLHIRESGPILNEKIYIPHHPNGWAKRISKNVDDGSNAQITNLSIDTTCGKNQIAYEADTQGGTSGAPVIALKDHKVVGLHNCGGECMNLANNANKIFDHVKHKLPACETTVCRFSTTKPLVGCQPRKFCEWEWKSVGCVRRYF